jgi:CDGSH-type Zn-finger protein
MTCRCGFTTDKTGNCNGTHKIVKSVREKVSLDVESWLSNREVYDDKDLIEFIKTGRNIDK